jgi:hypothetical protein
VEALAASEHRIVASTADAISSRTSNTPPSSSSPPRRLDVLDVIDVIDGFDVDENGAGRSGHRLDHVAYAGSARMALPAE